MIPITPPRKGKKTFFLLVVNKAFHTLFTTRKWKFWIALIVIILFVNLPVVQALEISNVRAEDVTENSAVIRWQTDQPADSFASYGQEKESFSTLGDALPVAEHQISIKNLNPDTEYFYQVKSSDLVDDNSGQFYNFKTLAPDTTPPAISVEVLSAIKGNELDIVGTTELNAIVNLYLNDALAGTTEAIIPEQVSETEKAEGDGKSQAAFKFLGIIVEKNQLNNLKIIAVDPSGNKAEWAGQVYADATKPKIDLTPIPEMASDNSVTIIGNISENCTYEIFVNDNSVVKKDGNQIKEQISLEEGDNKIKVVATDAVGWESSAELEISADTKAPTVDFTISKGTEFYQGRAESDIIGETEPGAKVYLYVYRPLGYEYTPDFKDPWTTTTADQNGTFKFDDVNFESEPLSLKMLQPKEVPPGLLNYVIFPIQQMAYQDRFTYYVFIIAEDKSGKAGYKQETINLETCYSADFDFSLQSLAQLQLPLALNPQLLDEGREIVTATFNLSYRGSGVTGYNLATGQPLPGKEAFKISSVTFEKACTQGMMEDKSTKLGCTIFPQSVSSVYSTEKTAHFLQVPLFTAEKLSQKKDNFWNEFKKRQIVFPMKIRINYQERQSDSTYISKTQTACYDLSYFVDIPLDSKEYIPDFLADEGLRSINWTINQIETVMPYVKNAAMVAGVTCVGSVLTKMITHYVRIVVSNLEPWFTKGKDKGDECPGTAVQNTLHTESEMKKIPNLPSANSKPFEERCPMTSAAWDIETALDQAYRWTCDRFFCRSVPAGWTSDKTEDQINAVIVSQQQCSAGSMGIPLAKVENCQEITEKNPSFVVGEDFLKLKQKGSFPCYRYNNDLYYAKEGKGTVLIPDFGEIVVLDKISGGWGAAIEEKFQALSTPQTLYAFKKEGSADLQIARGETCEYYCQKNKLGYQADKEKSLPTYYQPYFSEGEKAGVQPEKQRGCYKEKVDASGNIRLEGAGGFEMSGNRLKSGFYTADCFFEIDKDGKPVVPKEDETGFLSCVCVGKNQTKPYIGARQADEEEEWFYRQDAIYRESKGRAGTYYSKIRYYSGRDFSGAFGANYLVDYLREKEKVQEINPHTDTISTFQSVCLRGIYARLYLLQSILVGLKTCLEEAKYTGFKDAGVCKTVFSQHVCGLLYKVLAYFYNDCSPKTANDEGKGGVFEDVGFVTQTLMGSIPEAMEDSINELKSDYTDAQLNQFFATGAQGFAQSLCMAAFGYDFPMGMDFISESLYSFPMATSVIVTPAQRELAMFNPSKGTAVYNYNLGAVVVPGCKIKTAEVYLKCIGKEDLGHAGVNCGKQKCDCLNVEQSIVPGEKTKHLDHGIQYDLRSGSVQDLHLPSPQKVDSFYRYDHVVVELQLDQSEEANREKCFDEGYRDGIFYFPITDVSPPSKFVCQADYQTGRYLCPEVLSMFGPGSGAYLEEPYISCYEKNSQTFIDCSTPGIFTKGDTIRVRGHVMTDGQKSYCLKTTVTNLHDQPEYWFRQVPEKLPGLWPVELNLGIVDANLFSGASNTLQLVQTESDPGCSQPMMDNFPKGQLPSMTYTFTYSILSDGKYQVNVPPGVTAENQPSNVLIMAPEELKSVVFNFNGLLAHNIVGAPSGTSHKCTYQIASAAGQGFVQNQKSFTVRMELFEPDVNGYCGEMNNILVKPPVYGRAYDEKNIVVQLEPYVSQAVSRMYQNFVSKNYNEVLNEANQIINRKKSDLEDAEALYYALASYIVPAGDSWKDTQKNAVCSLLNIFFKREYLVGGEKAEEYPLEVKQTGEFQKIYKYLEEINKKVSCGGIAPGLGTTGTMGGSASS